MEQRISVKAQTILEFIENHFKRGWRSRRIGEAVEILLQSKRRAALYEKSQRNESIEIHPESLYQLAEKWRLTDIEKFVGALVSTFPERETFRLPTGDASRAEIEVTRWGENILADPKYTPANKYVAVYVDQVRYRQEDPAYEEDRDQQVAVYVDQVRFRQEDKDTNNVLVKNGTYIWIMPASGLSGAVVLPVDVQSGDILLVNQYRHPQRRFLTEAPRGFGMLGIDLDEAETARREMKEETGAIPLKNRQGEQLYFLRTLYTDTGKLWESPSYYLAFVNGCVPPFTHDVFSP